MRKRCEFSHMCNFYAIHGKALDGETANLVDRYCVKRTATVCFRYLMIKYHDINCEPAVYPDGSVSS